MDENRIRFMLDQLADLRAAIDKIDIEKQAVIDTILTDEIKARLQEVDDEFMEKSHAISISSSDLEAEIKKAVIEGGQSVKGKFLHAIFSRGRVSWDAKALDAYAISHPQIIPWRKEGDPSVSIRKV